MKLSTSRSLVGVFLLMTYTASNAEVVYYHTDLVGSPIAATDENGNIKWREQYKPFGERVENEQAAGGNRQWYTGRFHDEESGLTYMGARYYDPVLGRFMGIDPIGYSEAVPSTFNRYAYAANNPYVFNDPDGEFVNFVFAGVKAAIENVVIQHLEMQLGLRDEFSFGELAVDTGLGVVTSGFSSFKTAGKLAILANKAEEARRLEKGADRIAPSGTQFTYRGDDIVTPDEAFSGGFSPKGASTDLLAHARDSSNPPSAFISTSRSSDVAGVYGDNVYVIRPQNGVDVNQTLGPRSPFPDELEVAIPGGVSPSDVRAVTQGNVSSHNIH